LPEAARGELPRKLVHVGVGGFAFALRVLSWPQAAALAAAAFLFNWQVLPRIGGRALWRSDERERGYPSGILLYPLSVLGLVLFFREELWMAATVWGLLAFGDGMATLIGQAVGGPRLPWNPGKSWAGLAAFVAFGSSGAALLAAWTLRLPLASFASPRLLGFALPLAVLCALAESAPSTLDDNLTVPLVGAALLPLLAQADAALLLSDAALPGRVGAGLLVNGAIALAARRAGSIDTPGAASAVLIGTLITAGTGLAGFALMLAFFVVGSAVTRLGYREKAARGIAQERGGARGWRNAWANGGVPALLAVLAGMSGGAARDLLVLAYAASVATAAADTCASEIGKAYGRRSFLITTLRPVPPGTEGAVSLEGTLAGLLGATLVAALGAVLGLYGALGAALVAIAGLLGSLAESVIGTVAEKRGWLDNDLLNATNTAIGAAVVYGLARASGMPRP
jgi:uncharacterized protein (TIGR00297 family)